MDRTNPQHHLWKQMNQMPKFSVSPPTQHQQYLLQATPQQEISPFQLNPVLSQNSSARKSSPGAMRMKGNVSSKPNGLGMQHMHRGGPPL